MYAPRGMSDVVAWLVLFAYFIAGLVFSGLPGALLVVFFLAIPFTCILWPEIMSELGKDIRTVSLPPELVFGLGWFVFLLPAVLAVILWLMLRTTH